MTSVIGVYTVILVGIGINAGVEGNAACLVKIYDTRLVDVWPNCGEAAFFWCGIVFAFDFWCRSMASENAFLPDAFFAALFVVNRARAVAHGHEQIIFEMIRVCEYDTVMRTKGLKKSFRLLAALSLKCLLRFSDFTVWNAIETKRGVQGGGQLEREQRL